MLADNDTRIHNDASAGISAIAKAMKGKGFKYKTKKAKELSRCILVVGIHRFILFYVDYIQMKVKQLPDFGKGM